MTIRRIRRKLSVLRMLNETHNPDIWSWVPSANAPDADFPLQNLPFGVFVQR